MNEMLVSGVELMLIGMGIVFMFLALLVVAINIMSSLVTRFLPEPAVVPPPVPSLASKKSIDPGVTAAISAAIYHYKKQHSQR